MKHVGSWHSLLVVCLLLNELRLQSLCCLLLHLVLYLLMNLLRLHLLLLSVPQHFLVHVLRLMRLLLLLLLLLRLPRLPFVKELSGQLQRLLLLWGAEQRATRLHSLWA